MTKAEADQTIVQEYEVDAAPDKLWRAVSITEYREQWLPSGASVPPQRSPLRDRADRSRAEPLPHHPSPDR